MWKPWVPAPRPVMRPLIFTPGEAFTKVSVPATAPSLAGCNTATARVTEPPPGGLAAGEGEAAGAICAAAAAAASDTVMRIRAVFMIPPGKSALPPLYPEVPTGAAQHPRHGHDRG